MLLKDASRASRHRRLVVLRRLCRVTPLRAVVLGLFVVAYVFRSPLYSFYDYASQKHPWSIQRQLEQTFTATEDELACLSGSPHSGSAGDAIPNVVHFMYIFKAPLAQKKGMQFDFINYLAVRSAIVSLQPTAIFLHHAFVTHNGAGGAKMKMDPLSNPWIRRLRKQVHLIEHYLGDTSGHDIAYLADIRRLQILRENGGVYIDMDAFALRPFTSILNPPRPRDIVLGHEGGNRWGLRNSVIAARKNSMFVHRWLDEYERGQPRKDWTYKSTLFPKALADKQPDEVCTLPPTAFFWPTWTWNHVRWMHEPISKDEAQRWQEEMRKNGGALFEGQLAYHAWSHMASDRYLSKLTPEIVRKQDTRFNLLVRRFLEDDV